MGGRFAITAAALEPGIKAVFGVSTGPYGGQVSSDSAKQFLKSIEPASYLPMLTSRELVMFHFTDDPVIPVSSARELFDAAQQPKVWHEYNGSIHGIYSDIYAGDLCDELRGVFGR
jgi:fermentation-respiration switch protein FrsA (DUF1100 family)